MPFDARTRPSEVVALTVKNILADTHPEESAGKEMVKPPAAKVRTKVVVRHLPPKITADQFFESISKYESKVNWKYFMPGYISTTRTVHSRAYLNFNNANDIVGFAQAFNGHVFVDAKDREFRASVEWAPLQKVPKEKGKQRTDHREGELEDDPDYKAFLEELTKPVAPLPSADVVMDMKEKEEKERIAAGEAPYEKPNALLEELRTKKRSKAYTRAERRRGDRKGRDRDKKKKKEKSEKDKEKEKAKKEKKRAKDERRRRKKEESKSAATNSGEASGEAKEGADGVKILARNEDGTEIKEEQEGEQRPGRKDGATAETKPDGAAKVEEEGKGKNREKNKERRERNKGGRNKADRLDPVGGEDEKLARKTTDRTLFQVNPKGEPEPGARPRGEGRQRNREKKSSKADNEGGNTGGGKKERGNKGEGQGRGGRERRQKDGNRQNQQNAQHQGPMEPQYDMYPPEGGYMYMPPPGFGGPMMQQPPMMMGGPPQQAMGPPPDLNANAAPFNIGAQPFVPQTPQPQYVMPQYGAPNGGPPQYQNYMDG